MIGWVIVTIKKLFASLAILAAILGASKLFSIDFGLAQTIMGSFIIGMLLPDLDVLSGAVKKMLHFSAALIFLLAALIIFLYPASVTLTDKFCSDSLIQSYIGIGGLGMFCNAISAILLLAILYLIARMLVGWIPQKNYFHSWLMAIVMAAGAALFAKFMLPDEQFYFAVISFFAAYAIHLYIDHEYHVTQWFG